MISTKEAITILESRFPESKPKEVYNYSSDYYMIIAPSMDEDFNDPFYIISKHDGKIRYLNPLEDLDSFEKALDEGPIKKV